ncbi:MAG: hypothetical protein K0R69_2819, partial [Clostridia bacterium]|nr:hypothetical protein [Clostridia bacterium]
MNTLQVIGILGIFAVLVVLM